MSTNKIGEVCRFLEDIAPLHLQETYDNAGLLTGDKDWPIKGVLFALDATEEVVLEAVTMGCNLVISHHPIIFKGLRNLTPDHYVARAVIQAIKHDIALYAIHTNLDNVLTHGVSARMAGQLGLLQPRILCPRDATGTTGAGIVASLPEPISETELLQLVRDRFHCGNIRHSPLLGRSVQSISLCGGSGSFLIGDAIRSRAEVYITADLKYHEFFEANDQILLLDIGHFESEQFTIALLYELVIKNYSNFAAHCTKMNTNPVQYF
ncbi:MAG: Nif3-like dinuclear metal center hexameric protein [Saprospiraceae bacterium]